MPYKNKQEAVTALRPGWVITGEQPNMVKIPNPKAGLAGQPPEITEQQGSILTIYDPKDPQATPDTIIIKEVGNAPWKGGVGYDVVQGPQKAVPTPPKTPSASANLDKLDDNGDPLPAGSTAKPAFVRDPATGTVFQTKDDAVSDPSTWVPFKNPNDTTQVLGYYDPKAQKIVASVPQAAAGTRRTGTYTDLIDPNDPNGKRVIGKIDEGSKEIFAVSRDPTTQKQIVSTPEKIFVFDDQGKVVNTVNVDKNSPLQAVVIDGTRYTFDPNAKDPAKAFTKVGDEGLPKTIKQGDDTLVLVDNPDGTQSYHYPPGATPRPTLNTNTTAKFLVYTDPVTGKEVARTDNPNYQAPQVTPPTTNATSKMIPAPDPSSPTGWKWVKNEARVTASQALQDLASQLSGRVVDQDISVEEAQAIIKSANDAMATASSAAATTVSAINQGATAGANILNQRVQAAQNFVNQGLGLLGQTKHGLLVAPPSDFAANLVSGAAGFATELGGGPEVFQAAANLVRRADPTGAQGQDAAAAYATLTQMFQKYRQTHNGQPSPQEVDALKGGNGMGTGGQQTVPGPVQTQAVPNPFAQSGIAEGSNRTFAAPLNAVPGQNYGAATAYSGGIAPWNAAPGPSFTTPQPAAVPAPQQVVGTPQPTFQTPQMAITPIPTVQPQNRNITITVPT